jgi:hypothetical protein
MKQIIFWISAVVILTIGILGCSPVEPNNGNDEEPYYFVFNTYVTNHSDNEIFVIGKYVMARKKYNNNWEIGNLNEWIVNKSTNDIFKDKAMYTAGVPEGYDFSKRGIIIGIIIEDKTNYLVGFDEPFAKEFISEITNDAITYGFAYTKMDKDIPFSSQNFFRCEWLPDVEAGSNADFVLTVSNNVMVLNMGFRSVVRGNTNIITNIPYSN